MAFDSISIDIKDRVAWLTINHPPINLFDMQLIGDMDAAGAQLAEDDSVGAVVVQSADPEFFIAHADVNLILDIAGQDQGESDGTSFFHVMTERFRTMPKATIGKINGVARGGGLELLAAMDMRFCSIEKTVLAQPEVSVGIIPGGGGSARWPRMIGTGRALEMMLGGQDYDGPTAERYGIVNRALPAAELDGFVDDLARRIAGFPPEAIALVKKVAYQQGPIEEALKVESLSFDQSARTPEALARMKAFLDAGGQTREVELGGLFG